MISFTSSAVCTASAFSLVKSTSVAPAIYTNASSILELIRPNPIHFNDCGSFTLNTMNDMHKELSILKLKVNSLRQNHLTSLVGVMLSATTITPNKRFYLVC